MMSLTRTNSLLLLEFDLVELPSIDESLLENFQLTYLHPEWTLPWQGQSCRQEKGCGLGSRTSLEKNSSFCYSQNLRGTSKQGGVLGFFLLLELEEHLHIGHQSAIAK